MSAPVCIALDGYGGDGGPAVTLEGARRAVGEDLDLTVLFVADGRPTGHERILPVPSAGALPDGGHPAKVLRSHPDLSIGLATRLVADGQASAVVSMGHTGATMIAAQWLLKTVPGVRRAPAATRLPLPVANRPVLVDLGAASVVTAPDLAGFAALGTAYSQVVAGVPNPRVALLANGTEEGKGTPVTQEAYGILRASSLNFVGYVEPTDLGSDPADVLVADGFTGNLLIKWMEGTAKMLLDVYGALLERPEAEDLRSGLEAMSDVTSSPRDPVVLLGCRGVVVPGHGRASQEDVARALSKAAVAVRRDLAGKVSDALSRIRGKE